MHDDGLTPTQQAWLRARQAEEEFSHFMAAEIATMDMSEFARLSGRTLRFTPTEPPPACHRAVGPSASS